MTEIDYTEQFWQKTHLLTDSRQLISPADSIFFAIKGRRHDGHLFIRELYERGVRNFVTEFTPPPSITSLPDLVYREVDNSITVLQNLAAYHRSMYTIPVIAITGSNGKTIVKEWLYSLLEEEYNVVKSPKSYNSQIGVPLSVWALHGNHEIAVFECGISEPGEMEKIEKVVKPTLGIFTMIGTAHDINFNDLPQKVNEKSILFQGVEQVVCRNEHNLIVEALGEKAFKWSTEVKENVDVYYEVLEESEFHVTVRVHYKRRVTEVVLPFSDRASVENALHCLAMLLLLKFPIDSLAKKVAKLKSVPMRLELKKGLYRCLLIDDTYNNDVGGLETALNFLSLQNRNMSRTAILSDVTQARDETVYLKIRRLINQKGVDRLIAVGPQFNRYNHLFENINFHGFERTDNLLEAIEKKDLVFDNEVVLIKGARVFEFEEVSALLEEKVHGTRLEVNLDALGHNLNVYKSQLKPTTKLMVMVKAMAYGNGLEEIGNLLQYHLVDYLGVAYIDEGVRLRNHGIRVPVMVLNPSPLGYDKIISYDLEPEIYSLKQVAQLVDEIDLQPGEKVKVHINIDTGMRRLGFEKEDIQDLIYFLRKHRQLVPVSIFSHLAASDEAGENSFTEKQINNFTEIANQVERALGVKLIRHILNSSGIVAFNQYQMDMVRLGVGFYGVDPTGKIQDRLRQCGRLKTTVSQIKKVPEGDTIGYGRTGKARKDQVIATTAIGYADGYDRRFSNGVGRMYINGQAAPIIGRVCMDMTMLDITGLEVHEADEVIVFDEQHTILDLAEQIGTIPYEILTNVNERVKRVFYQE